MGFNVHVATLLLSVGFLGASGYERLEQGDCPPKFLSYTEDKCLHVSTEYVDTINGPPKIYKWDVAREACRNMSTNDWTVDLAYSLDVAVLKQFTEFIVNEEPRMKGLVFFVGAERDTPSGHWEWVNGELVDPLSYIWVMPYPTAASEVDFKTKLVPAGAFNRFYMLTVTREDSSPSFICEAAQKCD